MPRIADHTSSIIARAARAVQKFTPEDLRVKEYIKLLVGQLGGVDREAREVLRQFNKFKDVLFQDSKYVHVVSGLSTLSALEKGPSPTGQILIDIFIYCRSNEDSPYMSRINVSAEDRSLVQKCLDAVSAAAAAVCFPAVAVPPALNPQPQVQPVSRSPFYKMAQRLKQKQVAGGGGAPPADGDNNIPTERSAPFCRKG